MLAVPLLQQLLRAGRGTLPAAPAVVPAAAFMHACMQLQRRVQVACVAGARGSCRRSNWWCTQPCGWPGLLMGAGLRAMGCMGAGMGSA